MIRLDFEDFFFQWFNALRFRGLSKRAESDGDYEKAGLYLGLAYSCSDRIALLVERLWRSIP